jgi:hypothetical protein
VALLAVVFFSHRLVIGPNYDQGKRATDPKVPDRAAFWKKKDLAAMSMQSGQRGQDLVPPPQQSYFPKKMLLGFIQCTRRETIA